MFRLRVDQASIKMNTIEPLVKGRIGMKVQISFNQDWYDLTKVVSYEYRAQGETTIAVQDDTFDGTVSTIPATLLQKSGGELYIAIKGTSGGITVIPTIYAFMGAVKESSVPEFFPSQHIEEWHGGMY